MFCVVKYSNRNDRGKRYISRFFHIPDTMKMQGRLQEIKASHTETECAVGLFVGLL